MVYVVVTVKDFADGHSETVERVEFATRRKAMEYAVQANRFFASAGASDYIRVTVQESNNCSVDSCNLM